MMSARQFPLRSESELVAWCACTAVAHALKERIRQRVQEPLDRTGVLEHGASHLLSQPPGKPICVFPQRTRVGLLVTRYGLQCLHLFWRTNRKSIMADSLAYVGLDAMLKSFPGCQDYLTYVLWVWKRRRMELSLRLAGLNPA
jgi:hypothetical protein